MPKAAKGGSAERQGGRLQASLSRLTNELDNEVTATRLRPPAGLAMSLVAGSWRNDDEFRASPGIASPGRHERIPSLSERLGDALLSSVGTGLPDDAAVPPGQVAAPAWSGLQHTADPEPGLANGASSAHRRVTSILIAANVLSICIYMAELDPDDAQHDHLGSVFLVVVLITGLSLVQALGIRHGRQLIFLCRTRGGICGRLIARPLVSLALVAVPLGAFCNSYFATHCALRGCPNLDLEQGRTTDPDFWSDLKEVVCAAQNLCTLVGMVEVMLLLCDSSEDHSPPSDDWAPRDWWAVGDKRRVQRSFKLVLFFLGMMQPFAVVVSSLESSALSALPIPGHIYPALWMSNGTGVHASVAEEGLYGVGESEDALSTFVWEEGGGSQGGGVNGGGSVDGKVVLWRIVGQPMMVRQYPPQTNDNTFASGAAGNGRSKCGADLPGNP